jgi:putative ABC transport system ATP-binding protein
MSINPLEHRQPDTPPTTDGVPHGDAIIKIKNLAVTYFPGRSNEVQALKDISLEIYSGEYIIFFGPSGCGKSTLLYSIAGLERNITGEIHVENGNLATMSMDQIEEYHQRTIGMIFQSYYLIPSLSVADNVALPQVAIHGEKAARQTKARDLLTKFGVGAQADKLPTELSGGQQQRVAICRSLMNDSEIIVADEPVGNLDSKSSQDVMNLLRYLNDEQKKTVILVTHDPSHLHHAHRVFYLRDGQIMGTKINSQDERLQSIVDIAAGESSTSQQALSHWVRAYTPNTKDDVKKAVKTIMSAQHVVAEGLADLSVDEILALEKKLETLLLTGSQEGQTIYAFLSKPARRGGVGMPKEKAHALAHELQKHIRSLRTYERHMHEIHEDDLPLPMIHAQEIRKDLLDSLDIRLRSLEQVSLLDTIVRRRIAEEIERKDVQRLLMRSMNKGGIEANGQMARKISQRLESFAYFTLAGNAAPKATPTSPPAAPPPASTPPPPPTDENA